MKKAYAYLLLSALLGMVVLLQTGCVWRDSGYYGDPYYYDSYYGHPYGTYYGYPYSYYGYYGYYGYPYSSNYWWPYRSYHDRDYRYHYRPGDRYDDGQRIAPPRPPQRPPPDMNTYPLTPDRPKEEGRPPLDRPFLRRYQPERR